jgi:hypothetical protein
MQVTATGTSIPDGSKCNLELRIPCVELRTSAF